MITSRSLALLIVVVQLAQPSTAQWQAGKGAQANWYRDTSCGQFASSATAWWDRPPRVGDNAAYADPPECLALNPPGDAKSINVAAMWKGTSSAYSSGFCSFFDGYGCTGARSEAPYSSGNGKCLAARSATAANYLWKSARCYVDY